MSNLAVLDSPRLVVSETRLDIAAVLSRTVHVLRQRPLTFAAFAFAPLILTVPSGLVPQNGSSPALATAASLLLFSQSIVNIVLQGAVTIGAVALLCDEPFHPGAALRTGARRFFPYLLMSIALGTAIVLGFLLFIVPGLIAICAFAVAGTICLVERRGPIESLKRSADLTRHNRWRILAVSLVGALVPALLVALVAGVLGALLERSHLGWIGIGLTETIGPVTTTIDTVLFAVIFCELKQMKEGLSPRASIVKVFE